MAHMTCSCGHYMTNSKLPTDFGFECYSDELYHKVCDDVQKGIDEYYYIPEDIPEIWKCPNCNIVYWFDHGILIAKIYDVRAIRYKCTSIQYGYVCDCGEVIHRNGLYHCYSDGEVIKNWDETDFNREHNTPMHWNDSNSLVLKCPKCQDLYWFDKGAGIIRCYTLKRRESND